MSSANLSPSNETSKSYGSNETEAYTSLTDIVTPAVKIGEGVMILLGNILLLVIILSQKKLRKKEFLTLAGLAFGDALYGAGVFAANIRRTQLGVQGSQFELVTPWTCMKEVHNLFFYTGETAGSIMLVVVSMDRLLATKFFTFYYHLTRRYALIVLGVVYGYILVSFTVVILLSRFASSQVASVKALCMSTSVGPQWLSKVYLPNFHFWGSVASIVIFGFTMYYFKKNTVTQHNSESLKKQTKFTKSIGITILFTLFFAVIPQGSIILMGLFNPEMAHLFNPYAWLISNINNMANVFILGIQNSEVRSVLNIWLGCAEANSVHPIPHAPAPKAYRNPNVM